MRAFVEYLDILTIKAWGLGDGGSGGVGGDGHQLISEPSHQAALTSR